MTASKDRRTKAELLKEIAYFNERLAAMTAQRDLLKTPPIKKFLWSKLFGR